MIPVRFALLLRLLATGYCGASRILKQNHACRSVIAITIENQPIPTVSLYTACLFKRIFGQKNHFLDDSTPANTNPEFISPVATEKALWIPRKITNSRAT